MSLTEMVKQKSVKFEFYRRGELWYSTDDNFMFPVPIEDTGDGKFLASDKAILFMRYITKQLKAVENEGQL